MKNASVISAVHNGMGAKTALRIWGEVILRNGYEGVYPEGFGWPSMSIEARLQRFGHGAKESSAVTVDDVGDPVLTRPEDAVDRLESERAIASWVSALIRDMTDMQRVYAHLYWVRGKCWADIASQMEIESEQVERMAHSVMERVRRAMRPLRLQAA